MKVSSVQQITLLFSIAFLLCIWAYLPGLNGDFVFDDNWNIQRNHWLHLDEFSISNLWNAAMSGESGPLKRPVSMVTFAINHIISGLDPYWMKLTNLVMHVINSILVWFISYKILEQKKREVFPHDIKLVALLIAIFWMIHPIHVTTVSYIVQRMTLLASFFMLLSMSCYLILRTRYIGKSINVFLIFGVCLFFVLGLLSKEIAILTGLYLVLCELYLFNFSFSSKGEKFQVVILFTFLLLPICIAGVWLFSDVDKNLLLDYSTREFNLTERLLSQLRVISEYIKLIIFPDVTNMDIYRDDYEISRSLFKPVTTLTSLLFIFSLFISIFIFYKRLQLVSLGLAWFFCGHLLESTIFGLELSFLHRNYLPSLGLLFVSASIMKIMYEKNSVLIRGVLYVLFIVFLFCTRIISYQWSDDIEEYFAIANRHPTSFRANIQTANAYYLVALSIDDEKMKSKALEEAEKYVNITRKINPETAAIEFSIFDNYISKNIEYPGRLYKKLVESARNKDIDIISMNALKDIAQCVYGASCIMSSDELVNVFIALLDNNNLSESNRIIVLSYYAVFESLLNENYTRAIELQYEAVLLDPENPSLYINLIDYLIFNGNIKQAENNLNLLNRYDRFGRYKELATQRINLIKEIKNYNKE